VKYIRTNRSLSSIVVLITTIVALQGCGGSGNTGTAQILTPHAASCVQTAFKKAGTPLFALYSPELVHNLRVAEFEPIDANLNMTIVVLASPSLAKRLLAEATGPARSTARPQTDVKRSGNVVVFFGRAENEAANVNRALTQLTHC
jgi:hypothetical protein